MTIQGFLFFYLIWFHGYFYLDPTGQERLWNVICDVSSFPFFLSILNVAARRRAEAWRSGACAVFKAFLFPYSSILPRYLVKGFLLTLCNQNKCALNLICFWKLLGWGGILFFGFHRKRKEKKKPKMVPSIQIHIVKKPTMCNSSLKMLSHDGFELFNLFSWRLCCQGRYFFNFL